MFDFYLLSIIGFGLLGAVIAFRAARRIFRNAAMDAHCQKIMQLDKNRAGHA